jgi:hypothetical protein
MKSFILVLITIMSFFSFILFITMTNSATIFYNSTSAYAHLYSNITQAWTDKLNNVKIQFSYLPEKPTADDTIQLQFSIQNLQTGIHLKDLTAKVTIFNDPIYKYDNITVSDGDFSIRRLFLDSGMHQVILKVSSKDYSLALASFNISVL